LYTTFGNISPRTFANRKKTHVDKLDGKINFMKQKLTANIIQEIQQQYVPCRYFPVPRIQEFLKLNNYPLIRDSAELYRFSIYLEPARTADLEEPPALLKEILEQHKKMAVASDQSKKNLSISEQGKTVPRSPTGTLKLRRIKSRAAAFAPSEQQGKSSKNSLMNLFADLPKLSDIQDMGGSDLEMEIEAINLETDEFLEKLNKSTSDLLVKINKKVEKYRQETTKQIETYRLIRIESATRQHKEFISKIQHEQEIAQLKAQIIQLGHIPHTLSPRDLQPT